MAPRFEIVFPAYNEAERLKRTRTIERYAEYFGSRYPAGDFSILVVLNGCTDNTADVIRDIAGRFPCVRYVEVPGKGKGFALAEALRHVTAPLFIFADIDGFAGPREAEKLLDHAQGCDIVLGSRRMPGSRAASPAPLLRRINSAFASVAVRTLAAVPFADPFCGLKVFRTGALENILPSCKAGGSLIDVEILDTAYRTGMQVKEIPIEWSYIPGSKASVIGSAAGNFTGLLRIAARAHPFYFVMLSLLLVKLAYFIYYSCVALLFPYSINIVEGAIWASNKWAASVGYYPDFSFRPYWPTAYPPVFYIFASLLGGISGLGLQAGRIISLLSALGIAVLLGKNAAKRGTFSAGAVFFLLFLSINGVAYWSNLYRVDMLEAFFACLALVIGFGEKPGMARMAVSSALLSLALFTKASVIIPAAVLFLYWFTSARGDRNRIKSAAAAVFIFAALTSALYAAWQAATGGQFATQAFGIMLVFTQMDAAQGIILLKCFLGETWPIFIVLALLLRYRAFPGQEKLRAIFLSAGLACSIVSIFAAGSRIGSDTNYLIEPYIWLLLLAGSAAYPPHMPRMKRAAASCLYCVFILLSVPLPGSRPFFWKDIPAFPSEYFSGEKAVKDIAARLARDTDKYIISEDASIAISAGKMPVFEPYIMDRLWMLGLWDPSDFTRGIERGRYSLVYAKDLWGATKYIDSPLNKYYNKIKPR